MEFNFEEIQSVRDFLRNANGKDVLEFAVENPDDIIREGNDWDTPPLFEVLENKNISPSEMPEIIGAFRNAGANLSLRVGNAGDTLLMRVGKLLKSPDENTRKRMECAGFELLKLGAAYDSHFKFNGYSNKETWIASHYIQKQYDNFQDVVDETIKKMGWGFYAENENERVQAVLADISDQFMETVSYATEETSTGNDIGADFAQAALEHVDFFEISKFLCGDMARSAIEYMMGTEKECETELSSSEMDR